ncbi:hypothetical protein SAMN02745163_03904 [Clostridium cavendishii DSM 21758]|uniref:Uncharacterized protein n=1 Tax=Clostridium cavendishii DSM 21758 TaxID=1121302 RepID=A0A1M6SWN5_9CLOT|nr:hypothetical protein [Clostridium cavendishii]SHK49103.1 hypothetical protein SAMN02745163_03904 [Clostridium cavendishii DSM 21758]
MKQHLLGKQLKEVRFEERITLLSLVLGLNREYLIEEYNQGLKREDAMLMEYGYKINVGEMIGIIQAHTGVFPMPIIENGMYSINLEWTTKEGVNDKAVSQKYDEYCDALYEIVKDLFKKGYIAPIS